MSDFLQDLKYAFRAMLAKPAVSFIAIMTLAVGIGANLSIFTVIHGVFRGRLPVPEPDRLAMIWTSNLERGWNRYVTSGPDFIDWKDQARSFESMAAFSEKSFNMSGAESPIRVSALQVSPDFLTVLQVSPNMGHGFTKPNRAEAPSPEVVLFDRFWKSQFASDPEIVGRGINLDGESYTIVGIAPDEALLASRSSDLLIALQADSLRAERGHRSLAVIGRLRRGVTFDQAHAEIETIAGRLERSYPASNSGWSARVVSMEADFVDSSYAFILLYGAATFVLLIVCANVANLMLVRAAARRHEAAVRAALGAGRARSVRLFLTESLLISIAGAGLGFVFSLWGVDTIRTILAGGNPLLAERITMSPVVLGYLVLLTLALPIVFGIAPALFSSLADFNLLLKEGGTRLSAGATGRRLPKILVVAEISLAFALLIVTGLLVGTLATLERIETGFETENILTMRLSYSAPTDSEDHRVAGFFRETLERLEGLTQVEAAGAVSRLPTTGSARNPTRSISIEGDARDSRVSQRLATDLIVSPGYFRTLGIALLQGSLLTDRDVADLPPVAVISRSMASRYWPDQSPVGRRIKLGASDSAQPWITVAGVVGDVMNDDRDQPPVPHVYLAHAQFPSREMSIAVRTAAEPLAFARTLREEIAAVDPTQPIYDIKTMERLLYEDLQGSYFITGLLGIFSLIALLLAAVGIYGVMSYSIAQRTREIGIRMALGSSRGRIMRDVLTEALILLALGLTIGLVGAYGLSSVIGASLFGVSRTEPVVYLGVALTLALATLAASWFPATRATGVDPLTTLRHG